MLTKLANHIAKSADCKLGSYLPELAPVCTLLALSAADFDTILQATEVGEVWDIDRRIPKQLCEEGVVLESGSYAIDGCTWRKCLAAVAYGKSCPYIVGPMCPWK